MRLQFDLEEDEMSGNIGMWKIKRKGLLTGLLILENPYNQTKMKEITIETKITKNIGHKGIRYY